MSDMLVKLYQLPELGPVLDTLAADGIQVRRAIAPEKHIVVAWVKENFSAGWASEAEASFANSPVTLYVATHEGKLVGFACYEATCKNFFGPTGVAESMRGKGAGKGLLLASLHAMHQMGYGYAVIGSAGPKDYYNKLVGATIIEDSSPGVYEGMLKG